MRTILPLLAASAALFAGSGRDAHKLEFRKSHSIPFSASGLIRIPDSFGEVEVEGWDRDEVQIDLIKKTLKRYSPAQEAKAIDHLQRVDVRLEKDAADDLTILTVLADRSWKRPLRGESNLILNYKIHVPRNARLEIRHGVGSVKVNQVAGELSITSRIGEIDVRVPDLGDEYFVDAKVRIGGVESDFAGNEQRRKLIGAAFHGYDDGAATKPSAKRLTLRLGIGAINVRRYDP